MTIILIIHSVSCDEERTAERNRHRQEKLRARGAEEEEGWFENMVSRERRIMQSGSRAVGNNKRQRIEAGHDRQSQEIWHLERDREREGYIRTYGHLCAASVEGCCKSYCTIIVYLTNTWRVSKMYVFMMAWFNVSTIDVDDHLRITRDGGN